MKRGILLFLFVTIFLLNISLFSAAPLPWGIAINSETNECAGYWGGDENIQYDLPEGWTSYYPEYEEETKDGICIEGVGNCTGKFQCKINELPESFCWDSKELCENVDWCKNFYVMNTEIGTCYFNSNRESCCNELGLTYVSSNIGNKEIELMNQDIIKNQNKISPVWIVLLSLLGAIVLFFVVRYFVKKKK
jgi:hypothetical protein